MAGLLTEFLQAAASRAFAWGEHDCMLFLADWVQCQTLTDPAAHLRGTYSTEEGSRNVVRQARGLVRLVPSCLRRAGIEYRRVQNPQPGDIAVVLPNATGLPTGAIWTRTHWAGLAPVGVGMFRGEPQRIWRVCPQLSLPLARLSPPKSAPSPSPVY